MSQARQQITRAFTYHPPNASQVDIMRTIREEAKAFAELLDTGCPDGREKAVALTKLEETVMWANAAIVRDGK